ncbi:hypothetical protein AMTR_s00027p00216140 [Amborella trichopoda]|uniref:Uncharacterized protein n=1 Tax=Amborella trichopoda TaxID=13333 RepID=W1PSG0_AMBTC|nr:hypothetical protein AMTR_s00027p00216140 [Amborella trichopoda]
MGEEEALEMQVERKKMQVKMGEEETFPIDVYYSHLEDGRGKSLRHAGEDGRGRSLKDADEDGRKEDAMKMGEKKMQVKMGEEEAFL